MLIDIVHSKTSLSLSTSFIIYPFVIMVTCCCSIHHEPIDKGLYDRPAISFSINRSINYKFPIFITKRRYSIYSIHNDKINDKAIFRPTERSYN